MYQPVRCVGLPKYRKRGKHISHTASNSRNTIRPVGRRVRLSGIGWVHMRESLRFAGDVTPVTVSLPGGHRHAAFPVATSEPDPTQCAGETVGINMGLTVLTTFSNDTRIRNPKAHAAAWAALPSQDWAVARSRNAHGKHRPYRRRHRLYELRNRQ